MVEWYTRLRGGTGRHTGFKLQRVKHEGSTPSEAIYVVGQVAERFKALVLKTSVGVSPP